MVVVQTSTGTLKRLIKINKISPTNNKDKGEKKEPFPWFHRPFE